MIGECLLTVEVVTIREGGPGCEGEGEILSWRARIITVLDGESTFDGDTSDLRTMVVLHVIVPRL